MGMKEAGIVLAGVILFWVGLSANVLGAGLEPVAPRQGFSLDGDWQVAEGAWDTAPARFDRTVPVPGLVDMALPAFEEVGRPSPRREAFWYRRTFSVQGAVPEVALLKLHKARYGSKVILNGQLLGEHLPSFTAAYFDLRPHLQGEGRDNELIIRVGAHRESLPLGMPTGWDFEKYLYLPGIYDSVKVILAAAPYIVNVQTVPDLETGSVRVVAEIEAGPQGGPVIVHGEVREARSKRRAGESRGSVTLEAGQKREVDFVIPVNNCRWWSPEDPFLYELTVRTESDAASTRFGMRTFHFEAGNPYALLNGKRYFLRGSNVTVYRFFEDAERGDNPWREEWVRRLHRQVKSMHWNSLRYCIGFPPDFWYDIADELGILIQDEFPIWTLGDDPEKLEVEKIVPEYTAWMRERWNHPSVVIWDAQNESIVPVTGQALEKVRALDLSNRPWENGWAEPQRETDCVEAHPYLMIGLYNPEWGSYKVKGLAGMAEVSGVPHLNEAQRRLKVPIIINEYAWLWLTRDGEPTTLTGPVYETLLGPDATADQRRRLYARYLAAKTEFWRAHRECAGILHFCVLGYSRPGDKPRPEGGATSDHWVDVERLVFEPHFERYVRDAFAPVGVMLDFWSEELSAGDNPGPVRVYVINDLEREWKGRLRLRLMQGKRTVAQQNRRGAVAGYGREILTFQPTWPTQPGHYMLVAEIEAGGSTVRSERQFTVGK
jgi:beta-galactosidase